MQARGIRRPSIRSVAITVAAAGIALALGAAPPSSGTSASPWGMSKTRPKLPDGCGDSPTLNGVNQEKEILCGSSGNDTIQAGPYDIVKAYGGADKIYAKNGAPNDIDGGAGSDTAWIDSRWDRPKGIQQRYTSSAAPRAAAVHRVKTPRGSDYNVPSVLCIDDPDGSGSRQIALVDYIGSKPQIAAFDANAGYVDWQYVAWSTVIYKYNWTTKAWNIYSEFDWLWDRTYDLTGFTQKKHAPNVWHSYVEGQDDQEAELAPFTVTEPGDYTVRFRYYWYGEPVEDPPGVDLTDMPSDSIAAKARTITGKYAAGNKSSSSGQDFYCRFPAK